jgi:hypothetical protein
VCVTPVDFCLLPSAFCFLPSAFDVRYIARTASPDAIAMDAKESNELMWVDLDRAATLMKGEESQRVLWKIGRLLCR